MRSISIWANGGHLSHDAQRFPHEEGKGRKWMVTGYEAGDVVFHSPWMIHGATKNEDESGRDQTGNGSEILR